MFNANKKRLYKLIETDRYKNANYRIEKVNGLFAIKEKSSGDYVDLCNGVHRWQYGSSYTSDCLGSLWRVLKIFDFCVPIVKPINVEMIY